MQNAKEHGLNLQLDTSTPTSLYETATSLKERPLHTKERKALFSSIVWKLSTFTSFYLLVRLNCTQSCVAALFSHVRFCAL